MPYCERCGAELSTSSNFCRDCGLKVGNQTHNQSPRDAHSSAEPPEKKSNVGKILTVLTLIVVIVGAGFALYEGWKPKLSPSTRSVSPLTPNTAPTAAAVSEVANLPQRKQVCPYECCEGATYEPKSCPRGYDCVRNDCIALDSDGDGLNDLDEAKYGTNPNQRDTDRDGLDDRTEVKIKNTNPLNANTDGDRYNDKDDREPTRTNSAKVTIAIQDRDKDMDFGTAARIGIPIAGYTACTVMTGGLCAASFAELLVNIKSYMNLPLYENNVVLKVTNHGDDYTSYFDYSIKVYTAGEWVKSVSPPRRTVRVGAGETYTDRMSFNILVKDVIKDKAPNILKDFDNLHFEYRVEDVQYEEFN